MEKRVLMPSRGDENTQLMYGDRPLDLVRETWGKMNHRGKMFFFFYQNSAIFPGFFSIFHGGGPFFPGGPSRPTFPYNFRKKLQKFNA